jgi:hypothetical protein
MLILDTGCDGVAWFCWIHEPVAGFCERGHELRHHMSWKCYLFIIYLTSLSLAQTEGQLLLKGSGYLIYMNARAQR